MLFPLVDLDRHDLTSEKGQAAPKQINITAS
jgi:hypothetical protein